MAYKDFKEYIQRNYDWLLKEAISSFVNMNHDGQGFHSLNVLSLLKQKVKNVEVKKMSGHDDIGPRIKIDVHASAEIISKGLGTSDYDEVHCAFFIFQTRPSRVKAGGFMSTLILKRIGSTIMSGESTAKKMLAWTEEGREILAEQFDTEFEDDEIPEDASEIKNLTPEETECLRELVAVLSLNHDSDPKYKRVLSILKNGVEDDHTSWKDKGCIIFSQYFDSARFLARSLSMNLPDTIIGLYAGGDKSGCFLNGNFEKHLKDDIKADVKARRIKVLVGTDSASEGLNLQTLSTLINLDLPWNPTRLEQRKGRIQRIGQISDKVMIFNLRYTDSVEDKVHKALSGRLNDIYNMFGQILDTLEDVWIDVATNNMEKAMERIDTIPKQNPFTIKYETIPPVTENWDACTTVLDKQDKMKQLMHGW